MTSTTGALLRQRTFRTQISANFISAIGLWLHTATAAWVMLKMTGSPLMVGLLTSATFLPRIVFSVPAGAVVDALDIRRLILWSNVFQLVVVTALAASYAFDRLTSTGLLAATLLMGVGQSLSIPAYQTMLPDLVPRELAGAAIAAHIGSVNVARGIGPAIGGAFVAVDRADLAFLTNACSYLAVCLATRWLPTFAQRAEQREPVVSAVAMGVRFVRHSPALIRILVVSALFGLCAANLQALLAPMAEGPLDPGARGYGALYGCLGAGAVVATLLSDRLGRLSRSMALQTPMMVVYGLAGLCFAVARHPALSAAAVVVAGASWLLTVSALNATMQLSSPRWVRGRALSLYFLAFTGSLPAGSALAGWLAELLGTPTAIGLLSAGSIVVGGLSFLFRPPPLAAITTPAEPAGLITESDVPSRSAGRVTVLRTWRVSTDDLPDALWAAGQLRHARFRSGATRWQLFQDPDDNGRLTELVELISWADYLRQDERIDPAGADALDTLAKLATEVSTPTVLVATGLPQLRDQ